ncbi:MAG: hypothetical protein J7647_12995 [Cyanobacteria bacterium SBLK]|nr:hypothetical protein [Cyanobacteria bacterium SBLK]
MRENRGDAIAWIPDNYEDGDPSIKEKRSLLEKIEKERSLITPNLLC